MNREKLNTLLVIPTKPRRSSGLSRPAHADNRRTTDGLPRLLFYCGLCGCSQGSLHVSTQKVWSLKLSPLTHFHLGDNSQNVHRAFLWLLPGASNCFPDLKSSKLHTLQVSLTETRTTVNSKRWLQLKPRCVWVRGRERKGEILPMTTESMQHSLNPNPNVWKLK